MVRRLPMLGWITTLVVLALSTSGCQSKAAPTSDAQSLERHADELKKQHQWEMENREPPAKR